MPFRAPEVNSAPLNSERTAVVAESSMVLCCLPRMRDSTSDMSGGASTLADDPGGAPLLSNSLKVFQAILVFRYHRTYIQR